MECSCYLVEIGEAFYVLVHTIIALKCTELLLNLHLEFSYYNSFVMPEIAETTTLCTVLDIL